MLDGEWSVIKQGWQVCRVVDESWMVHMIISNGWDAWGRKMTQRSQSAVTRKVLVED